MPRELKDDGVQVMDPVLPRSRIIKTNRGEGVVEQTGFDFATLDGMKGYRENDPLPKPTVSINRRGMRVLKKVGEPRYYFNENELIQVYLGLGGKKRKLWWIFKKAKPLHVQIRKYLRNMEIPGA
jgi:hypothetical protein